MNKTENVIGVLGGMGPEATASFYMKLIKETKASKDQDHFRTIIDSNPKIPDRTQAILHGGISPVKEMIVTAKNLESAGATVLVIPCITAHHFYTDVQEQIGIPIYNVLDGLKEYIDEHYPDVNKIGVIATTGTRETKLFPQVFNDYDVCFPDNETQDSKVMQAIFGENGIKQGNIGEYPKRLLMEAARELIEEKSCEIIIGGCTEVELVLKQGDLSVPLIDPMQVAALKLVN